MTCSPGIPDEAGLAETFYSQFDDEFESGDLLESGGGGGGGDDNDATLRAEDEDEEDLLSYMQLHLDRTDTGERTQTRVSEHRYW